MRSWTIRGAMLAVALLVATPITGVADEGMWLFTKPPKKYLADKYKFEPDAKWRTHRAFGVTRLAIDPAEHRLSLAIDAPKEMHPLHSLDVAVYVTDDAGQAVRDAAVTPASRWIHGVPRLL